MKNNSFKVQMFITSFIPLWASIVFINAWEILSFLYEKLNGKFNINHINTLNIYKLIKEKPLEIFFSSFIIIILSISCHQITSFIKNINNSNNKSECTIKTASRAKNLGTDFLLAYILPMVAFNFSNLRDVILFSLFMLTLCFLCVRNDNVYTNLFLEFMGYKMYNVDVQRKILNKDCTYNNTLFISKTNLINSIDHTKQCYDFNNSIYIELDMEENK